MLHFLHRKFQHGRCNRSERSHRHKTQLANHIHHPNCALYYTKERVKFKPKPKLSSRGKKKRQQKKKKIIQVRTLISKLRRFQRVKIPYIRRIMQRKSTFSLLSRSFGGLPPLCSTVLLLVFESNFQASLIGLCVGVISVVIKDKDLLPRGLKVSKLILGGR